MIYMKKENKLPFEARYHERNKFSFEYQSSSFFSGTVYMPFPVQRTRRIEKKFGYIEISPANGNGYFIDVFETIESYFNGEWKKILEVLQKKFQTLKTIEDAKQFVEQHELVFQEVGEKIKHVE